MHREAREFVTHFATPEPVRVIEIGSLNVNGTVRDLFPNASWTGVDRIPGSCVDWVGDAVDYTPEHPADIVICCEVLEHANNWADVIAKSAQWLKPQGVFVMTCAGLGREPHSCDGGPLKPGEYYQNLSPTMVKDALRFAGYKWHFVRQFQTDTQAFAILP